MQRIIGIDFGTSTTYMNVKRYNGTKPAEDRFSYMPVMFNYGESSGFVATIVRENADGTFDFGAKASEQLEGSKIYSEIKMLLESPDEKLRADAQRITRAFFRFLYETYSQQSANLGSADDEEETIISYPVKWQEETARFMLDAAREAGFRNVRGMDEATAAVSTVLCHNANNNLIYADKPGYLMLVDMGAGTTDLVVCRYQADTDGGIRMELVTSWPKSADEPTFGGREIDQVLEHYVEDYLRRSLRPEMAAMAHGIASSPGQAKMWKERNVSFSLAAGKPVNTCAYVGAYKSIGMLTGDFPAFGRTEFEAMAQKGLLDYVRLLLGCLMDTARTDPAFVESGLDLVVLTGGHSAWYFAREIVDGTMDGYLEHPALAMIRAEKHRVVNLPNPQTTVSLGLVYSKLPFRLEKSAPKSEPVTPEPPKPEPPKAEPPKPEPPKPEPPRQAPPTPVSPKSGAPRQAVYDASRCPNCGSAIPVKAKKCPMCGRTKLRELTTPFKLGMVSRYKGEKKLGIANSTGSLTILDDRIEYRKHFGNTAAALTPYSAVYSVVKNNMDPKDIFWLRDILDVRQSTYGMGVPALVLTMRSGEVITFAAGMRSQGTQDTFRGAVQLIGRLQGK